MRTEQSYLSSIYMSFWGWGNVRYCLQPRIFAVHFSHHLHHHYPPNVQLYILYRTVYRTVIVLETAREHVLPLLVDFPFCSNLMNSDLLSQRGSKRPGKTWLVVPFVITCASLHCFCSPHILGNRCAGVNA